MSETSRRSGSESVHRDITVRELKARLDRGESPQIVDVREPREHAICSIPGAQLIPLAQLPHRLGEIDRSREVVLHCKMGGRSARATAFLQAQGFSNARNLTGGMLAWIDQVDPTQPKY